MKNILDKNRLFLSIALAPSHLSLNNFLKTLPKYSNQIHTTNFLFYPIRSSHKQLSSSIKITIKYTKNHQPTKPSIHPHPNPKKTRRPSPSSSALASPAQPHSPRGARDRADFPPPEGLKARGNFRGAFPGPRARAGGPPKTRSFYFIA